MLIAELRQLCLSLGQSGLGLRILFVEKTVGNLDSLLSGGIIQFHHRLAEASSHSQGQGRISRNVPDSENGRRQRYQFDVSPNIVYGCFEPIGLLRNSQMKITHNAFGESPARNLLLNKANDL